MRKILAISIGIILMSFSAKANSLNYGESYYNGYGKSYIFVVQNVEFSVFPDGQFDFTYVNNYSGSNVNVTATSPYINISYNGGYNYDVYVQYDQYGAVIQIEDIPIYYDEFGRIAQAGDVEIYYRDRRIAQIGGLYIHYNYYGNYSHCTGYINPFNYYYVYQPWHRFYIRPIYASCIVYDYPYRRYYYPERYTYYDHSYYYSNRGRSNVAYANGRRSFYRPGSQIHYKDGRTAVNKDYKANRRNTAVTEHGRRDHSKVDQNRRKSSLSQNSRPTNTITKSDRRTKSTSRKGTVSSTSNTIRSSANRGIARTDNTFRNVSTSTKMTSRNNNTRSTNYKRSTSSVNKKNSVSNNSMNRNTNNKISRNSTSSNAKQKTTRTNNSRKTTTSSRRGIQ